MSVDMVMARHAENSICNYRTIVHFHRTVVEHIDIITIKNIMLNACRVTIKTSFFNKSPNI